MLGLAADQDGFLYASRFGSSNVLKIDPRYVSTVENN